MKQTIKATGTFRTTPENKCRAMLCFDRGIVVSMHTDGDTFEAIIACETFTPKRWRGFNIHVELQDFAVDYDPIGNPIPQLSTNLDSVRRELALHWS